MYCALKIIQHLKMTFKWPPRLRLHCSIRVDKFGMIGLFFRNGLIDVGLNVGKSSWLIVY